MMTKKIEFECRTNWLDRFENILPACVNVVKAAIFSLQGSYQPMYAKS